MKIITSYGTKHSDENFSVSLEIPDVSQIEDAPETINEMLQMAKKAVLKQIEHSSFQKEECDNLFGDDKELQNNKDGKITAKQIKFIYQLLKTSKKIFGNDATDFLKNEFQIKTTKDISFNHADIFIKKLLKETGK